MPRSGSLDEETELPWDDDRLTAESPVGSAPEARLSSTGIQIVDPLPWGSRLCAFYETAQDLIDANADYFAEALKNHEAGLWAVSPPLIPEAMIEALRRSIPDIGKHLASRQFEIVPGYVDHGMSRGNPHRLAEVWREKSLLAMAKGFDGFKLSINAPWQQTGHWSDFHEFERVLGCSLAGRRAITLSTYAMNKSRLQDVLEVAHAHRCTVVRWRGQWEILCETDHAHLELPAAAPMLRLPAGQLPGGAHLTRGEYLAIAQIVQGASSKQAARTLGISPRTVEFHRANAMRKLGAHNTAALVRMMMANVRDSPR